MHTVGNDGTRRTPPPRSHGNSVASGIIDVIPHNQEIIYISHFLDHGEFIFQLFPNPSIILRIAFLPSLLTEVIEVTPGIIPLRHIEVRKLRDTEFDVHLATVRDFLCVLQRFLRIGKKSAHLLFTFHIILTAFIAHPVGILHFFPRLNTKQKIVRLRILCIRIMTVVGRYQWNSQLCRHTNQRLIDPLLIRNAMILQFQIKMILSKAVPVLLRRQAGFIITSRQNIP